MGSDVSDGGVGLAVKVKRMHHMATMPKMEQGAAGAWFYLHAAVGDASDSSIVIGTGETRLIGTGLEIAVDAGHVGLFLFNRQILVEIGIRLASGVNLLEASAGREVCVTLENKSKNPFTIYNGDRIARAAFMATLAAKFQEVE